MDATNLSQENFDEKKSLKVIMEMIQVSKKKLRNDGILLLVWGYAASLPSLISYFKEILFLPNRVMYFLKFADPVLPVLALAFTIYYIYTERKKVTTYIGTSLRYVWISLFGCMVLTNLILMNVTHEVNFTLQHPLFMVLTAFAVLVTGVILRYKLIILGGVVFGILAYTASFMILHDQLFLDGIGWFLALAVPGHIMYYQRNR
ncbi:MAG: hypothetical protein WC384_22075 [Prolixibacteraceae bacterium]|jgi:hypothetical protein